MTQSASPAAARPFAFDTEFDASGIVITSATPARPVKRVYLAAEVEALVASARAEARAEALAEADGVRAMALAEVGRAAAEGLSALATVAQTHRIQSADLSLAAARVMAGEALGLCPEAPLKAAIESLAQELDASPRLTIRARDLDDAAREAVTRACAEAGHAGQVVFRDDAATPVAAFCLEWADGRAEFDPAEAAGRVEAAMRAALAAEHGHAEPLTAAPTPGAR